MCAIPACVAVDLQVRLPRCIALRRRQESEIDFHKLGFILMAAKALRVRLIFVKSQSYLAYLNNASADDHRNADRTIIKSTVAARIKCCIFCV